MKNISAANRQAGSVLVLLAAILVLAAVIRTWHIFALYPLPLFENLIIDSKMYDDWAMAIAKGNWLGTAAFYMDPLYSYLLAIHYSLFGHNLLMVRLLQAAMGVGLCLLLAVMGRRIGGDRVGLIAALLAALYQPLVFEGGEIEKTASGVFLITASLACATGTSTAAKWAAGSLLALGVLCRGNLIIMWPLGTLFFLLSADKTPVAALHGSNRLRARILKKPAKDALAFTLGFLLMLAPVLLRNHYVSGEWILTTSQLGANFYTGNNPENWSGAYNPVSFVRSLPEFEEYDFRVKAEELAGKKMTAAEASTFWLGEAVAHIEHNPAFASLVFVRKIMLFWGDLEIPDGWSLYFIKKYSPALSLSLLTFGWIFPFALIGAVVSCRMGRETRLLLGFVLAYFLSVILFFVFSRYRIYVVPPLLIFAALGINWLWNQLQERNWRKLLAAGLTVTATTVFSFYGTTTFGYSPDIFIYNYAHLAELYEKKRDYPAAEALLQEAMLRQPGSAATLCALGTLRLTVGDPVGAVDYLERCLQAENDYPNAWNILGVAYERRNNYSEASRCYARQLTLLPGHQQAKNNLQRLLQQQASLVNKNNR